jgi:hypothetical protein
MEKYANGTLWKKKRCWVEVVPTVLLPKYVNWVNDEFATSFEAK